MSPEHYACSSPKLLVSSAGVTAPVCAGCYARDHESPPPQPPLARDAPCRHRGEVLRLQECPSCCGTVRLKVRACALHGECTAGRPLPPLACCARCTDYHPAGQARAPDVPTP